MLRKDMRSIGLCAQYTSLADSICRLAVFLAALEVPQPHEAAARLSAEARTWPATAALLVVRHLLQRNVISTLEAQALNFHLVLLDRHPEVAIAISAVKHHKIPHISSRFLALAAQYALTLDAAKTLLHVCGRPLASPLPWRVYDGRLLQLAMLALQSAVGARLAQTVCADWAPAAQLLPPGVVEFETRAKTPTEDAKDAVKLLTEALHGALAAPATVADQPQPQPASG